MLEKKARKRTAIIISAGSILLLLCGVLLYFVLTINADSDESYLSVFNEYAACLADGDYERMFMLTSAAMDEEEFITRLSKIYSGINASSIMIEAVDIEKPEQENGGLKNRIIAYHMTMDTAAGPVEFTGTAVVTAYKNGKEIKHLIDWDHDLIFPNLTASDTVSVKTLKGKRGVIYDRNGEVLAGFGTVKSVGLIPGKMNEETNLEVIAELLGISVETINRKLNERWVKPELFVPLKSIAESDVERKEALLLIPGIRINDETDRVYPLGEAAAHLTGYLASITAEELEQKQGEGYNAQSKIGKVGVEALLEERIRGIDGCSISILNEKGEVKEVLIECPAVNGEDVYLTIDIGLQQKLYSLLKDDKSSAVIINPYTGEVLAIVSTPAYDPNEFILGVPQPLWDEWNTDEHRPLYNRFKATYSPGSSFKPVIAAIGLTTGAFTAEENFGYTGRSWQKDSTWGSYTVTTLKDYGHDVSLNNAMVNSDNIYFARAALKIGEDDLSRELKSVGFGENLPFAFGIAASSFGTKLEFGSEIELADSGYGQGKVQVSALHITSLYSSFLNGGSMITPRLILDEPTEFWKEGVFTSEVANTVKDSLIQVIESPSGTAHEVKLSGRVLGGKTGTAEIKSSKDDEDGTELGWFVSFNMDDKMPLLIAIMVEDVKGRGGSHYVTPIAREIFEEYTG